MLIIPAIDLKNHQVVRLSQGKMDQTTIYSNNPLEFAQKWIEKGAQRLHLIDLNGAFEGKPVHFEEVKSITEKFPHIEIEVGGGIRNLSTIQNYLEAGAHYCILGTAAVKNPEFVKEAAQTFPNKIIIGIDAKKGLVATEGWDEVSSLSAVELSQKYAQYPIASIIYTDIAKDGMMQGMNLEENKTMAEESPFPIIASGGLTHLDEITELKKIKNILGVIAGKSLYENLFTLEEALEKTHS